MPWCAAYGLTIVARQCRSTLGVGAWLYHAIECLIGTPYQHFASGIGKVPLQPLLPVMAAIMA